MPAKSVDTIKLFARIDPAVSIPAPDMPVVEVCPTINWPLELIKRAEVIFPVEGAFVVLAVYPIFNAPATNWFAAITQFLWLAFEP